MAECSQEARVVQIMETPKNSAFTLSDVESHVKERWGDGESGGIWGKMTLAVVTEAKRAVRFCTYFENRAKRILIEIMWRVRKRSQGRIQAVCFSCTRGKVKLLPMEKGQAV